MLPQRAMASLPGRPNDHPFLSTASAAARRIVLQGPQTISTPVRWDAGDYEVRGSVVVAPTGTLEIATAGPGMRCEIAGGITVEPGGRLVIGAPGRPKFTCVTRSTVEVRGTEAARGAVTVRNSAFELLGPYDLDATFKFAGGRLITSDGVLIGGGTRGGRSVTSGFDLSDGIWEATDTTVQLIAGIWVSGSGVFNGRRLKAGDIPDAIHCYDGARVTVTDSTYDVLFTLDATKGGAFSLDLPANRPIHWDVRGVLPNAGYSLRLVNSTVPLWWLNSVVASRDAAPPTSVILGDCSSLAMHLTGTDLRNAHKDDFRLPVSWHADPTRPESRWEGECGITPPWHGDVPAGHQWDTGNLHWRVGNRPVPIGNWGFYPSGATTNVTLRGPSKIAELPISEGKITLIGTPGTFDLLAWGLFYSVGPGELSMENVSMGLYDIGARSWKGQFVAQPGGTIRFRNARLGILSLRTQGGGQIAGTDRICAVRFKPAPPAADPDIEIIRNGGRIDLHHTLCPYACG